MSLLPLLLPVAAALAVYLTLLRRRLDTHPRRFPSEPQPWTPPASVEEKLKLGEHSHITPERILADFPAINSRTGHRILVVGGSGFVGAWVCRLLLLRGEDKVRVADILPPPEDVKGKVDFVKLDLRSEESIREVARTPFADGGHAEVVYHLASVVKYVERGAMSAPYSDMINVDGTRHLLKALQELDRPPKAFVYTSSINIFYDDCHNMRVGWYPPNGGSVIYSDETPIHRSEFHYSRSKSIADKMVRSADGLAGMRTLCIRPACVIGVGDLFLSFYFRSPGAGSHSFGGAFAQSAVNVVDLAVAHILGAAALLPKDEGGMGLAEEAGGRGFLCAGDNEQYLRHGDWRKTLREFSPQRKDLTFTELNPLPMYLIAHVLEAIFFCRLFVLTRLLGQKMPPPTPAWAGITGALLQPGMWETTRDVYIDDSRLRKLLGYRHHYSSMQSIKVVTDHYALLDELAAKAKAAETVPGNGHAHPHDVPPN